MLIRHAEKPVDGRAQGFRLRGEPDAASLTAMGWQRAGALVAFFAKPSSPHVGLPDHLFAARFDRTDANASRRSKQTIGPLARALGMSVDDRFGEYQEDRLVRAVERLSVSRTVLIAWSHENLPRIASALGIGSLTPQQWPDERFDLVWVFDRTRGRKNFVQVPQLLLAGDRETLIPLADQP
jgi:hypothetical protein